MQTFLDCIPCFVRQALEAGRMVTDDEAVQERVLRRVLRMVQDFSRSEPPARLGRDIHAAIREETGERDPYKEIKERYNRLALGMYERLEEKVRASERPFETAVRLAIAGNIIDFGVDPRNGNIHVHDTIASVLARVLSPGSFDRLEASCRAAERILYIGDNAGEIVFDRLLVEQLPRERVTFAVRGGPVINDATLEDARDVGLCDRVRVIDSGCDAPGTVLELCTDAFLEHYEAADLVIAKGQGNFETLNTVEDKELYFLLLAKCPVIARHIGCAVGDAVVHHVPAEQERAAATAVA